MKVTVARSSGFCFGVKNAVDTADTIAADKGEKRKKVLLGEIVHNELVIKAIRKAEAENDVVVLAQGSMTAILPLLGKTEKPVLTSPRLAVERVRKELGL